MFAYNPRVVLFIAILFNVLTVFVITGLLEYKGQVKKALGAVFSDITCKVSYFPRYFSSRAIACYVVTLIVVSAVFLNRALPFRFVLFGFFSVFLFFHYSSELTLGWRRYSPQQYVRKLFITALLLRMVYVVFIYFYYIEMTGQPHAYYAGDELLYHKLASTWREYDIETFVEQLSEYIVLSDTGYCWWLGLEYKILGTSVLPARFMKCFLDAFVCVLIYNLAGRNFGEAAGRIASVFYMLLPNAWYYCGVTLKETEMAFLLMLFVERSDLVFHYPRVKFKDLLLPVVIVVIMFMFRTALAAVMFAAMIAAVILSSGKQLIWWKKVLYSMAFGVWMLFAVGTELMDETQQLWMNRTDNQDVGYQWRAEVDNGNTFAKYASASVFAPLIFTIPFSTLVNVVGQENQMMLNGAYFIKNLLSGFVIFAMMILLFRGDWRKHVLPIAVMCGYLVVLVFSNFAHSERFHFPVLPLELVFAAFGVTQVTNRHKYWFMVWIVAVAIANILWSLVKLRGRGLA
jgi:hypothetical protein